MCAVTATGERRVEEAEKITLGARVCGWFKNMWFWTAEKMSMHNLVVSAGDVVVPAGDAV